MNHSMQINPDISFEVYDLYYMLMQFLNQVSKQEGSREQSTKRGIPGVKVPWQGSVWGIEHGKGRVWWVIGGQNKV